MTLPEILKTKLLVDLDACLEKLFFDMREEVCDRQADSIDELLHQIYALLALRAQIVGGVTISGNLNDTPPPELQLPGLISALKSHRPDNLRTAS